MEDPPIQPECPGFKVLPGSVEEEGVMVRLKVGR